MASGDRDDIAATIADFRAGRLAAVAAVRLIGGAIARRPDDARLHTHLGEAQFAAGDGDGAIASFRRAVALDPGFADGLNNLGGALAETGRPGEAIEFFRRAAAALPADPRPCLNVAAACLAMGDAGAALEWCERARSVAPDSTDAARALGDTLKALGRMAEAVAAYRSVDAPDAATLNNLAGACMALGRDGEAADAFRRAVAADPGNIEILANLAQCLRSQERWNETIETLETARRLAPDRLDIRARLFSARARICDWREADDLRPKLIAPALASPEGAALIGPLYLLALPVTPAEQLVVARAHAARVSAAAGAPVRRPATDTDPERRLRIGYLSADFRDHPVAYLMRGVLERHDRNAVEVTGYAVDTAAPDGFRRRIAAACDRFVELGDLGDRAAASRIAGDGIDILVDLTGYTGDYRAGIPALRPAPVQAAYLGYMATTGAGFIDYIVTDRIATPPERQADFAEALAYLPDCLLATDDTQKAAGPVPDRAALGLPADAVVFAGFNDRKIAPEMFGTWMGILDETPGGVLWLFSCGPESRDNLRRAAAGRGIDPERLIFAGWADTRQEHLDRLQAIDLFLDTSPYNAHATACDMLWAAVPVLTCPGDTFASRIGASLLHAMDAADLVAADPDTYRDIAVALGRDAERRNALRHRLATARSTGKLFDTARFTRNLERAYREMWRQHCAGAPPRRIDVPGGEF